MELNIEINRAHYPGLEERNLCYCFKIYCDHFKAGDDYDCFKKYFLVQVNFNNFSNPGKEEIKDFYLLDVKEPSYFLTKNICILNVDIASCFNKFLKQIVDMSKDKDIQDVVKLEDNIEYRFNLVREDALERGISQGAEEKTIDIIKEMLKNNIDIAVISNVTGKSINEIKEIEKSIKE